AKNRSVSGVSTTPGHTQFARMRLGASSRASERVSWTSAAFDALYAAAFRRGAIAFPDAMFTTAPPSRIIGIAARQIQNTPVTLTRNASAQISSDVSATGGSVGSSTPALFDSTSIAPNVRVASASAAEI